MTPACRMFGSGTVCATPRVTTRASPVPERRRTTMRVLAIALIIGLLLAVPGSAQQPSEKLGTVNFPTSCNSAAQTEFSRAVALLHSFWFSYAIKGFEATVQADPSCVIAYWGAAVAHYLIHSYDFPPIANKGLDAARSYAKIAPSAPHAQHMPSHIFTRLGYWQESIDTNRASVEAAKDELRQAKLEAGSYNALHAMDYIEYATLQLVKDKEAKAVVDEVRRTEKIDTEHFAAAFAFTAIPARYALERRQWGEAAELTLHPKSLSWQKFPQAESILWFARGLGAARGRNVASAKVDLARIEALRDSMTAAKNTYWAGQAEIQRLAVASWIARAEGRNDEALALLRQAADAESATEKHPVTPGAIQPAREMLGELLLELNQPAKALAEFEASQRTDPNRFHGLAGAGRAAELAGDRERARKYYGELLARARTADSERPELKQAKAFLAK